MTTKSQTGLPIREFVVINGANETWGDNQVADRRTHPRVGGHQRGERDAGAQPSRRPTSSANSLSSTGRAARATITRSPTSASIPELLSVGKPARAQKDDQADDRRVPSAIWRREPAWWTANHVSAFLRELVLVGFRERTGRTHGRPSMHPTVSWFQPGSWPDVATGTSFRGLVLIMEMHARQ